MMQAHRSAISRLRPRSHDLARGQQHPALPHRRHHARLHLCPRSRRLTLGRFSRTVILEKLLDIFVLVLLFVAFMGRNVNPHSRLVAEISVGHLHRSVFWCSFSERARSSPSSADSSPVLKKTQRSPRSCTSSSTGSFSRCNASVHIGIFGSLLLLVQTFIIWTCEGMIFVSAVRLIGLATDRIGPWQAVSSPTSPISSPAPRERSAPSSGPSKPRLSVTAQLEHARRALRPRPPRLAAHLRHRSRWHHLPHPPHPHPQPQAPLLEEIETLPSELP